MSAPRFSIIVPTRDRPAFVTRCLASIAAQTFVDFEVVLCDNPSTGSVEGSGHNRDDPRVRRISPPHPLAVADNWEFALGHARGEYVTVLLDKCVLYPSTLQALADAIDTFDPDQVCWSGEGYTLVDEARSIDDGWLAPAMEWSTPAEFDTREEVAHRFSMSVPLGAEGGHYFRGKACFGAYSRSLVERIHERTGRVFHPLTPDYTSTIAALVLGERAVDLARPGVMWTNSRMSTGFAYATDPSRAMGFIVEGLGEDVSESFPISGLYTSAHNLVAYDLETSIARLGLSDPPSIDLVNLTSRAHEDLSGIRWTDEIVGREQREILQQFASALGVDPSARVAGASRLATKARSRLGNWLTHRPHLDRFVRRGLRLPAPGSRRYESPLAAVVATDRA